MKRRLAIALLPATLGIGLLQAVPARATATPQPKVAVNTTYVACAGNFYIGRGVCVPWNY